MPTFAASAPPSLSTMLKYCDSPKAELVAIYGRRRVGKTYLIKQYFDNQFDFYFTGSFETAKNIQLRLFKQELERYSSQKRTHPRIGLSLNYDRYRQRKRCCR